MVIEGVGDTGNRPAAIAKQTDSEQKPVTSESPRNGASRPDIEISATALYLSSTEQAANGNVTHRAAPADSAQSLIAIGETISEPEAIAHKLVQLEQLFFKRS